MQVLVVLLAAVVSLAWSAPARAVPVDLELVLAIDVSGSVDPNEFALQRDGWVAALQAPAVVAAIQGGTHGAIAVTVVFWSAGTVEGTKLGIAEQVVPWTVISDETSAANMATLLAAQDASLSFTFNGTDYLTGPPGSLQGSGQTGVARALDFTRGLLEVDNGFEGTRRVIDLSGDGYENFDHDPAGCTPPEACPIGNVISPPESVITNAALYFATTAAARDAAVAAGITINGLPILTDIANLDTFFYGPWATGGDGSFVVAANGFADIEDAATQKLITEVVPEPGTLALLAAAAVAWARARSRAA
jgi:hypothetical protein